jgi:hypothetical protein
MHNPSYRLFIQNQINTQTLTAKHKSLSGVRTSDEPTTLEEATEISSRPCLVMEEREFVKLLEGSSRIARLMLSYP